MFRFLSCICLSLLLTGCSAHPSYEYMQSHFEEHRATFSMIAAVACEIGRESDAAKLSIKPDTAKSEALLDLASTVEVDSITYREKNDKCSLSMPVFENENNAAHQQFAYRYNVSSPRQYNPEKHSYEQVKSAVSEGNKSQVAFDMELARRWFFSFFYKNVS